VLLLPVSHQAAGAAASSGDWQLAGLFIHQPVARQTQARASQLLLSTAGNAAAGADQGIF
jgi:hypothetical protein